MSTVDPAEIRRARDRARVGSTSVRVQLAVFDLLVAASAALLARAMFAFSEVPADTGQPPALGVFGVAGGLPLLLLSVFGHISALRRYTGALLGRTPFVGIFPLLLTGFAAGAWWGWSALAHGWLWIPVAVSLSAAAVLVVVARARTQNRGRQRLRTNLLATGRIVTGVVTDIAEIDASSSGLLGPITVKFSDETGTDRWVTKTGQWRRSDLPACGDPATVLFDPSDPGNTGRMWIGPPGARAAADFFG